MLTHATPAVRGKSASRPKATSLSRRTEALLGALGILLFVLIWHLASMTGLLSARVAPPPAEVLATLVAMIIEPNLWVAIAYTVGITVLGVVVIVVIAVPLSIAIHASRVVGESTRFVIEFLKPIPGVALIPLTLLLWGPTEAVKLFLIVFGALWPMLTQLIYGLREVSGTALETSRAYQFTTAQRLWRVVIPSMTPFALTGLRISATIALIISVVTEYIVGVDGVGQLLALAQLNGNLSAAYALILVAGMLGLGLNGSVAALSAPLLFWHPSQRERSTS